MSRERQSNFEEIWTKEFEVNRIKNISEVRKHKSIIFSTPSINEGIELSPGKERL